MEQVTALDLVFTRWFMFWMLVLFLASIAYNRLIDHLHQQEQMEQWTWLTVVFGVAYTLLGAGIATWGYIASTATTLLVVAFVFVVTGLPMALGDLRRWGLKFSTGSQLLKDIRQKFTGGRGL
jgi:hypothetical protein